jgi:hypothetical protein
MKYIICGQDVRVIRDLQLLEQTREVCSSRQKIVLNERIRQLRRIGVGLCRPTLKLPCQLIHHHDGQAI